MRLLIITLLSFSFLLPSCKTNKGKTEYEVRVEFNHQQSNKYYIDKYSSYVYLNDVYRDPNSGDYTYILNAKSGDKLEFRLKCACDLVNNIVTCLYDIEVKIYIDNDLYRSYYKKREQIIQDVITLPVL